MANRILLDINVCLDFLLKREPFSDSAGRIFQAVEHERLKALISAISFDTMFYVLRPSLGSQEATNRLQELTLYINIGTVNKKVVYNALKAGWRDLEDALQYHTAIISNCDALITRNTNDFTPTGIPVLTPSEFISAHL